MAGLVHQRVAEVVARGLASGQGGEVHRHVVESGRAAVLPRKPRPAEHRLVPGSAAVDVEVEGALVAAVQRALHPLVARTVEEGVVPAVALGVVDLLQGEPIPRGSAVNALAAGHPLVQDADRVAHALGTGGDALATVRALDDVDVDRDPHHRGQLRIHLAGHDALAGLLDRQRVEVCLRDAVGVDVLAPLGDVVVVLGGSRGRQVGQAGRQGAQTRAAAGRADGAAEAGPPTTKGMPATARATNDTPVRWRTLTPCPPRACRPRSPCTPGTRGTSSGPDSAPRPCRRVRRRASR